MYKGETECFWILINDQIVVGFVVVAAVVIMPTHTATVDVGE
jgi:hypothetical protein